MVECCPDFIRTRVERWLNSCSFSK